MRVPSLRISLTMSQWSWLTFVPPTSGRPLPSARWTVPSIFSSKSVFFMCRVIPGLQPMPSSPEPAGALVEVELLEQELLVGLRRGVDDLPALEAEADPAHLAAAVDRRELAEDDLALGRVLDR